MNQRVRDLALFCIVLGAVALADAQPSSWWREIPEKEIVRLGPDFSRLKSPDVQVQGQWKVSELDGAPVLAESGRGPLVLRLMRPSAAGGLQLPCSIEAEVRFAPNTAIELFTSPGLGALGESPARLNVAVSGNKPFEAGIGPHIHGVNLIPQTLRNPKGRLANLETTTQTPAWAYSASEYQHYTLRPDATQWPETVRTPHEAQLARVADFLNRWTRLRIELLPGMVRFYVDSRFVAEGPCARPGELVALSLGRGCALRSLIVREMAKTDPRFHPLDLRGHLNANAVGEGADAGDGAALDERSLPAHGLV
ncbi:MAG: hypothetical protein FJ278_22320, partial [Planctomycetes bacterium]|nr:hypothetical protein [Planctomycetota bacterium]